MAGQNLTPGPPGSGLHHQGHCPPFLPESCPPQAVGPQVRLPIFSVLGKGVTSIHSSQSEAALAKKSVPHPSSPQPPLIRSSEGGGGPGNPALEKG